MKMLIVSQLIKKFPVFYGTKILTNTFTRTHYFSFS